MGTTKNNDFDMTGSKKHNCDNPYKNMAHSWGSESKLTQMDVKSGMSINDIGQVGGEMFHDMSKMKFDFDKMGLGNSLGFNVRVSNFFLIKIDLGNMPSFFGP